MLTTTLLLSAAWLLWAAVASRAAHIAPRSDPLSGLALLAIRAYARSLHSLRVTDAHLIPASKSPGPLILVINHACGADPLLLQAACPFEITWLMGADMAHPLLSPLWRHAKVISIDRHNPSGFPLRDALRALLQGRVLAIFPEGRIERPPATLLPFHPGVSLLIQRSNAPVLPILITNAPVSPNAWTDLLTPSRALLRPIAPPTRLTPDASTASALRETFRRASGWPLADAHAPLAARSTKRPK